MTPGTRHPGLFITGTDTGVGKTMVAAALVRLLKSQGIHVGAYKPAASGAQMTANGPIWSDVEALSSALDHEYPTARVGPHCFLAPVAPNVAARLEGRHVDAHSLLEGAGWWQARVNLLIVEGAGGLLCPVTEEQTMADLARALAYPLVIVARATLGTINHTLLTIEAARRRGLRVAAVLLNQAAPAHADDASVATNAEQIARFGRVEPIISIPFLQHHDLLEIAEFRRIDWFALAQANSDAG